MNNLHLDVGRRALDWAQSRPDIQLMLRTGSRARRDNTVDQYSDHDIELYTTEVERYESLAWLTEIAPVRVVLPLDNPDGGLSRLTFFDDGSKVDFQVLPAVRLGELTQAPLSDLHQRGYEVLFDRRPVAQPLVTATFESPRHAGPTVDELAAVCNEFWFEAMHIPRYLDRGDLWVVKFRDLTMKELLLKLIEWDAVGVRGRKTDVWHIGTKMASWAAPDIYPRLDAIFGRWDGADARRAFVATAALFSDLTRRVINAYGLPREPMLTVEDAVVRALEIDLGQAD